MNRPARSPQSKEREALNRKLWLTESRYELRNRPESARIVGIAADVDDENVARAPAMTLYYPFR